MIIRIERKTFTTGIFCYVGPAQHNPLGAVGTFRKCDLDNSAAARDDFLSRR